MFKIGDKVVYPMYGAGIIEAIEKKEVLGETRDYYILTLPLSESTLMVPVNSDQEGLREVIPEDEVDQVLTVLRKNTEEVKVGWNRRYQVNLEKLKSGDVFLVAEVVRNLMLRDLERGLSGGERKMLENSRQILVSELVLTSDCEREEVEKVVDTNIKTNENGEN